MPTTNDLEQRLLQVPAARARFLADTVSLLEQQGVDVQDTLARLGSALNNGEEFLNQLAASSIVVTSTSTGHGVDPSTVASTIVVTSTSTGHGADPSTVASSIVITSTSTGRLTEIVDQLNGLSGELQQIQSSFGS